MEVFVLKISQKTPVITSLANCKKSEKKQISSGQIRCVRWGQYILSTWNTWYHFNYVTILCIDNQVCWFGRVYTKTLLILRQVSTYSSSSLLHSSESTDDSFKCGFQRLWLKDGGFLNVAAYQAALIFRRVCDHSVILSHTFVGRT